MVGELGYQLAEEEGEAWEHFDWLEAQIGQEVGEVVMVVEAH